jgi:hypothetical protein
MKIKMQQMMELLLAKFNASMKEHMQEMKAKRKADQAKAKANQEDLLAEMEAKMDANQAKADGKQEEMLARMREDIKSGKEEIRSIVDAWMTYMNEDRNETTACHDAMEGSIKKMEPNSGEKEAVVERQEISNEEVVIHSLKACRSDRGRYIED